MQILPASLLSVHFVIGSMQIGLTLVTKGLKTPEPGAFQWHFNCISVFALLTDPSLFS